MSVNNNRISITPSPSEFIYSNKRNHFYTEEILAQIFANASNQLYELFLLSITPKEIFIPPACEIAKDSRVKIKRLIDTLLTQKKLPISPESGFETIEQLEFFLKVYGNSVRTLNLTHFKNLSDADIKKLLLLTPNLEFLELDCVSISIFPFIKDLSDEKPIAAQQNLNFADTEQLEIFFKEYGNCVRTLNLSLFALDQITEAKDTYIKRLLRLIPNLEFLKLDSIGISSSSFIEDLLVEKPAAIEQNLSFETNEQLELFLNAYGNSIRNLDLSDFKDLNDERVKRLLSLTPNIEKLDISDTSLTGSCFVSVKLDHLKELKAEECEGLLDEHFKHLKAPNLTKLNIHWTSIDGSCFTDLHLPSLTVLNLSNCTNLLEENLHHIKVPLRKLNISYTNLTGSFLENIPLDYLEKLNLYSTSNINLEIVNNLKASRFKKVY